MYCGAETSSPSASRSWRMQSLSTASPTNVSGHTASRICCLVINWPGRSTRYFRTAEAFGLSAIVCVSRRRPSFASSSRNAPKVICLFGFITETPPQHYNSFMTSDKHNAYPAAHDERTTTYRSFRNQVSHRYGDVRGALRGTSRARGDRPDHALLHAG